MTGLRKQIDLARGAHRAVAYPGDLALETLGQAGRRTPGRILLAGGALAAAVALVVLLHRSPAPHDAYPAPADTLTLIAPPSRPEMPREMPLSAPYPELSSVPAMPSFPSMLGNF